jgi:hypothetical protein
VSFFYSNQYASSHPFHPGFETQVSIHPRCEFYRYDNEDEWKLVFESLDGKGGSMHIDMKLKQRQRLDEMSFL